MKVSKAAIISFVLLTAIAAGTLWVSAQVEGEIHACVNRKGSLRVVGDGEECKPQEWSLSWNIQGPQGPPGSEGPPGPQGPEGPQGQPGISGLERVCQRYTEWSCPRPGGCVVTVDCPVEKQVVGGGAISFKHEYFMVASVPSGNGWYAVFRDSGDATTATTIDVCAICADVAE